MNFRAIIFDMDGLLVDSEVMWAAVETEMVRERGREYTHAEREQLIGLRLDEFSEKLIALLGFDESPKAFEQELIDRMLERIPTLTRPQPGAPELVQYVHEKGIPTAIASSSPISIIDAIVASQGWQHIFTTRISADTVGRGKPAPDVYLKTADVLGVNPADCLALEDSPNGARAAVGAGMTCFAVPDRSHNLDEQVFRAITPHVLDTLHDALDRLRSGDTTH